METETGRRIALVTGASKGIGAAVAETLARDGFDIWLNYRGDDAGAASVAERVEKFGSACTLLKFDVAEADAVNDALSPLLEGALPFAIVNNAGFTRDALLAMMDLDDYKAVLSVHLDGFFNITRAVMPKMIRKRRGRVVNMVSVSGQTGVGGQVAYSSAKAGLIGATRSLAVEVGKRNILVNAVAPGFIDTDMLGELPLEKILPEIPMGRLGTPMEVAEMVAFLCSDKATYITGQVFGVNGGIYT